METVHSIEEAIKKASLIDREKIFIVGGAQIYTEALLLANKLDLTLVEGNFNCDTFFPDYSGFRNISERESFNEQCKYKFVEFEKI